MNIRTAEKEDIKQVVRIHIERFPNFFLSSLGKQFLKTFYRSFLKLPGLLIVLEDENKIKGFACGNYSNHSFYKKLLLKNIGNFTFIGINLIFSNPKGILRILSNLKKSNGIEIEFAELLSIATVKNKKGYGAKLLNAFEDELKINPFKNAEKISLTTDYENNDKAIRFYKQNDYQVLNVFESYENRKMYRFIKNL